MENLTAVRTDAWCYTIECSCTERGLIEVSFELKLDAHPLPLKFCQSVYLRSWPHPDFDGGIAEKEYDRWQVNELLVRIKREFASDPSLWKRLMKLPARLYFKSIALIK